MALGSLNRQTGHHHRVAPQNAPYYGAANGSLPTPELVDQIYRAEFDVAYHEGGLYVLTMHPHYTGHRSRALWLEKLIVYMKSKPGVWSRRTSKWPVISRRAPRGSKYASVSSYCVAGIERAGGIKEPSARVAFGSRVLRAGAARHGSRAGLLPASFRSARRFAGLAAAVAPHSRAVRTRSRAAIRSARVGGPSRRRRRLRV
jgi:hypothetical protein